MLKQIRGCVLVGAVRLVASGRSLLDPRATSKAMARLRDEADRHDPLAGLTARKRKILELIGTAALPSPDSLGHHHRTRSCATYADLPAPVPVITSPQSRRVCLHSRRGWSGGAAAD